MYRLNARRQGWVVKQVRFIAGARSLNEQAEVYHAVCVHYVALSCCLSAKQMAKSKQRTVPTKEDQRLDHTTKLEASLVRQCLCHWPRD